MDTASKKCPSCGTNVEITLITTAEAGKLNVGGPVSGKTILKHRKKLQAIRPGKEWLIQPEDLKLIADRKPGNPHTNKKPNS